MSVAFTLLQMTEDLVVHAVASRCFIYRDINEHFSLLRIGLQAFLSRQVLQP